MKRSLIYCRVSTEDQEREGTSLQTQLEACLKYCRDMGYQVVRRFSETCSGLTLERPSLSELRDLLETDNINVIVVYCLDRLSRDPTHGVILTQEFERHGVALEAVTETVESTDLGKLISYIRGFASKLEAEKIRERTTRGKAAYVKMGQLPIGTGRGLYGYKWDTQNKKRVPIEFEARVVERVFTMLADGAGCFNVARTLNDQGVPTKTGKQWSQRQIQSMSVNPAYVGMTYYGRTRGSRKTKLVTQPQSAWELLPDVTPPIITREMFDRVQERRQHDRELHRAKMQHDYLLRGHVVCGYCGSPLVGSFMNHRFRYYHCRATYPTAARPKTCSARYIRADHLEEAVWNSIRKVLENPELVMQGIKEQKDAEAGAVKGLSLDDEIRKLRSSMKNYESQERRLIQLLRYGEIDQNSLLDELRQLKKEREADQNRLDDYNRTKQHLQNLDRAEIGLKAFCRRLRQDLDKATPKDKRELIGILAVKITATPERTEIDGVIPLETMPSQPGGASPYLLTIERTSA